MLEWSEALVGLEFAKLTTSEVSAIAAISQAVATILSLFALCFSLWTFHRLARMQRWQLRVQRDTEVFEWARACIAVLAGIEQRLQFNIQHGTAPLAREEFLDQRARLSALIDEGRLYFPNIPSKTHGRDKEAAFRGHRQAILDALVEAYDGLKVAVEPRSNDPAMSLPEQYNKLRRHFVSETQKHVDPRRFRRIAGR